jgi:hypothetical protein
MGLDSIVVKLLVNTVRSSGKLNLAVDKIISKLKDKCPDLSSLKTLFKQKSLLEQTLNSLKSTLTPINSVSSTIETITTTLSTATTIIKTVPLPTSVPPGIGIPVNIITILADSLDTISDILRKNKGLAAQMPAVIESINSSIQTSIDKLNQVNALLSKCAKDAAENLSDDEKKQLEEELGIKLDEIVTESSTLTLLIENNPQLAIAIKDNPQLAIQLENNPQSITQILKSLNIKDFTNLNEIENLVYKGYRFEIQDNPNNSFSFPSRRIVGINIKNPNIKIVSNLTKDGWSYSPSLDILLKEIKTEIDKITS